MVKEIDKIDRLIERKYGRKKEFQVLLELYIIFYSSVMATEKWNFFLL